MRPRWLPLLLVLAIALPSLADAPPTLEQHAGKPILRDGSSPPTVTAPVANRQSLDLNSGQVALALLAVIGLILLLRYCTRKFLPSAIVSGARQTVKILARCPIGPRQQVLLLQVGKRVLVVGEAGAAGLSCLSQITDSDEVAALLGEIRRDKAVPVARPFAAWFGRASEAFTQSDTEMAHPQEDNVDLDGLPDDPPAPAGRQELKSLTDRVRDLTRQLGGPNNAV